MTEENGKNSEPSGAGGDMPGAEELVRSMGLVFNNSYLYGAEHGVTKKALTDSFDNLQKALASFEEVTFNVSEEGLYVNGTAVEQKNPLLKALVTQLTSREINSLTITRGLTLEKYKDLVEVMNAKPDELKQLGGFATALSTVGIEHVKSKRVVYQQVTEEDAIVSKEGLEKVVSKDKLEKVVASGVKPAVSEDEKKKVDKAHVENVLAFIKGDVSLDNPDAIESVKSASGDASQLGDLILRAADVRQEQADIQGGESFGNLVVGCLRRVYEGLHKDSSVKTQKGRKELAKTLMVLEKDVLDKMRAMAGEVSEDDFMSVSEEIADMREELKVEGLTSEYMKKKAATEVNEKRLLRYIKKKGLDEVENSELKKKLMADGLSEEGWEELLARSGLEDDAGGGIGGLGGMGGGIAGVGQLANLLTHLEESIEKVAHGAFDETDDIKASVEKVDTEVKGIVSRTTNKISKLVEDVREDEKAVEEFEKKAAEEGVGPKMSRKQMTEVLAEIGQELCQPLSVMSCSIDMMKGGSLGDVSERQVEMLDLASNSGVRLRQLIDRLMEISGMPEGKNPDEKIISSLY